MHLGGRQKIKYDIFIMAEKSMMDNIINIIRTIFSFKLCRCKSKCCDMDVEIDNRSKSSEQPDFGDEPKENNKKDILTFV